MYQVIYTGEILAAVDLGSEYVPFSFKITSIGPMTESALKIEAVKNLPSQYTCIGVMSYTTSCQL